MTATSSPWSREASPSVTLPAPPSPPPPVPGPGPGAPRPPHHVARQQNTRRWAWAALALLVVVTVSGGVSAAITYAALNGEQSRSSSPTPSAPTPSSPTTTPRYTAAETAAAKDHLCHVFDVSVRGQEGQGGLRVDGNVNVPVVLRSLNSAVAVTNALVPQVPDDVSAAARTYISTTLDVTTAAMGNTPTSEGNRLNNISNEATNALLNACGLPR